MSYLGICVVALVIALAFHWVGASLVLPFALVELLALGLALLWYAMHAADQEFIALSVDCLHVEQHSGRKIRQFDFDPRWVRIEPQRNDHSLVRLSEEGRCIAVGVHVQPGLRRQLASEFRWALRPLDQRSKH